MTEIQGEDFHDQREAAIRQVADFCFGFRDNSHTGAAWIRGQFVRSFGGEQRVPAQSVEYRLRFGPNGRASSAHVEIELTSVADARPVLDALFGNQPGDWRRQQIERHLEAATGRRDSRKRSPAHTIVRALAIHHLSRAGGGRRTFEQAWALYLTWFGERDAESAKGWDGGRQREVIHRLADEFGPLRIRKAA